jgi:hypothetical protein
MSAGRDRGPLITLLLVACVWLATLAADRPPAAKPLDAAAGEFSGERAGSLLQRLVGDDIAHPLGSAADAQVRDRIVGMLQQLGLQPELQSGDMVCSHDGVCGEPINILARIAGTDAGGRAVLLAAHYDSVAAGPGASDDGGGVAAVLEIARILQQRPRTRQSIILLLDEGEEPGLLGAQAFVEHHRWAPGVSAAVNLEARGTSGPSRMFETGRANRWLMGLYAAAIPHPLTNSVYYAVYQLLPNDTDFTIFKAAGYQGFNFAFIGDVSHYHTPLDNVRHADVRSLQHQGDNALRTLLALANAAPDPAPRGEAVYFDLFGRVLVRIPQRWVLPAALVALLLMLLAGLRLLQLQVLRVRSLLWGLSGVAGALLIGAIAAAALMAMLRAIGAISAGGAAAAVAHPWALELSFCALALCVTVLIGASLKQRAGFWGLWYAAALLYALLAVALAGTLAGASYVALLPALMALLMFIPAPWRGPGPASAEPAALALCGVTFVLVLPIALPLYSALGGGGLPLLTLLLIYSSFGLAALLCLGTRALRRGVFITAASALVTGLITATLLPRYSTDVPQRLNLFYHVDADTQRSEWIAQPQSGSMPRALLQAAAFEPDLHPLLPCSETLRLCTQPVWVALAPALSLPAPQLTLLSAVHASQRVHYRVHIASARAAPIITLQFPSDARIESVRLQGDGRPQVAASPQHLAHGESQLRLFSVPPQGQDLSFDAAELGFDLVVLDQSFGLPDEGVALRLARGALAVPSREGDATIVRRSFRLQP